MNRHFLPLSTVLCLFFIGTLFSCSKLDTTTIGVDEIPAVDNIHTFDTLIDIQTTQGLFADSLTRVARQDRMVLGNINNDPIFGKTTGDIYVNLKPSFYPYYFGNAGDTVRGYTNTGVDSIVLCLSFVGSWGDTLTGGTHLLQVSEVNDTHFNDLDSTGKAVNYKPVTGQLLVTKQVNISDIKKQVKIANNKDSVTNQIRIKIADNSLNTAWMNALYNRDSTSAGTNNAFYSDSVYKTFYHGLAIKAIGSGNSLMYINLADAKTRLEIHYRKLRNNVYDTTSSYFKLNTYYTTGSGYANNVVRNYSGTNVLSGNPLVHYLQTGPGTYINVKAPGLSNLPNMIVHRAYLEVKQIPDPVSDTIFTVPPYLYLDIKDTAATTNPPIWKTLYYDLNQVAFYNPDNKDLFYPTAGVDFTTFGGLPRYMPGPFSNTIVYYNLNITRYIQKMVTNHGYNYEMRLYAPVTLQYPQYTVYHINYNNPLAFGRVRIGSGTNPDYKMKLRIIYSKP